MLEVLQPVHERIGALDFAEQMAPLDDLAYITHVRSAIDDASMRLTSMMQTQIVRSVCHNDALVLESMAQNDIIRRREQARIALARGEGPGTG